MKFIFIFLLVSSNFSQASCLDEQMLKYLTVDDSIELQQGTIDCLNKIFSLKYAKAAGKKSSNTSLDLEGHAIISFIRSLLKNQPNNIDCKEITSRYGDTPYCYNDIWKCQVNHYSGSGSCLKQ